MSRKSEESARIGETGTSSETAHSNGARCFRIRLQRGTPCAHAYPVEWITASDAERPWIGPGKRRLVGCRASEPQRAPADGKDGRSMRRELKGKGVRESTVGIGRNDGICLLFEMDTGGFEPPTSALRKQRSSADLRAHRRGGGRSRLKSFGKRELLRGFRVAG